MKEITVFFESPLVGFLLKFLTGLAAAIFGIVGLGKNARDKKGNLTPIGKTARWGIILAGLLAIATSIYDFASGNAKDNAERQQAQELLRSVRRGIYPMRGMTVDISIPLKPDFKGLTQYKSTLRSHFPKSNLQALNGPPPIPLAATVFPVKKSSPLFPQPGSPVFEMINGLTIHVVPLAVDTDKRPTKKGEPAFYKPLGSFEIYWLNGLPPETSLVYNYSFNTLSFEIHDWPVGDAVITGGAHSLADIVPGAIAVAVTMSNSDAVCKSLSIAEKDCEAALISLTKAMAVEAVHFSFTYPKVLWLNPDAMRCDGGEYYTFRILPLVGDIESTDTWNSAPTAQAKASLSNYCSALSPK